jgi:hypothetical protein
MRRLHTYARLRLVALAYLGVERLPPGSGAVVRAYVGMGQNAEREMVRQLDRFRRPYWGL